MDSETFLTVDQQPISVAQALAYLRSAGQLPRVIETILRQHLIEQEIQLRLGSDIDPLEVEQTIINFRLQNHLADAEVFQQWLQRQNLTYAQFRHQIITGFQLNQLKADVTASRVAEYFQENQFLLNQVILSRIVVSDLNLAEELMRQLVDDRRPFEILAKAHSLGPEKQFNGMMGLVSMGQLPEPIREAIEGAQPGDIIGPVESEAGYTVFRVEQWQPVALFGKLKQELQEQMFEQWLQEKLTNKQIKLVID